MSYVSIQSTVQSSFTISVDSQGQSFLTENFQDEKEGLGLGLFFFLCYLDQLSLGLCICCGQSVGLADQTSHNIVMFVLPMHQEFSIRFNED